VDAPEVVVFPEDLSTLSLAELTALQTRALTQFDALAANENIDDAGVEQLESLAAGIEQVVAAINSGTVAMSTEVRSEKRGAAQARIAKARETVKAPDIETEVTEPVVETPAEPAVTASTQPRPAAPSLAAAQARAPEIPVQDNTPSLVITAAAPTSNVQVGSKFTQLDDLVTAVNTHSKSLVITEGRPGFQTVASIQNRFDEVIDGDRTSLGDIEAMVKRLRNTDALDALVAGGGWCAPSEIRYDFFNIACQDGMIDLPTFGVNRGGIMHPVSPSLADVFTGSFTNATNPWLWTEADDILTVTGAPNKPCVRVICPSFTERRLECYGICLTAGNLTDSAYPEATRNHLSLLMSAHYHAMNQRYIATMVALSTSAISFPTGTGSSIAADLPDFMSVAANDVRTRYGMCEDDILEAVVPRWAKDAIRSDLSRRTGDAAYLNMSESDIMAMFATRRVRVQWVNDWQIRGAGYPGGTSPLVAWPTSLDFMMYPAGTFIRGNGMTLDLGVVRDSVLNAENDHTAAWTEECHLIAKYGHESRLYRMPVCVGGQTGGTFTRCFTA
jgi:hypothetical protein